jgi:hypothetical protein
LIEEKKYDGTTNNDWRKSIMKQMIQTDRLHHVHLSLRKRLALTTTLLFIGGPLIAMASSQAAYAYTRNLYISIPAGTTRHLQLRFPTWQKNGQLKFTLLNLTVVCNGGDSGIAGTALFDSSGAAAGTAGTCTLTIPITYPDPVW